MRPAPFRGLVVRMILPAGLMLAGISLLAAANLGASGARAGQVGQGHTPVTICHWVPAHGGSYVVITVDDDGAFQGHAGHPNDIIPAPAGGCPGKTATATRTATPTRTSVPIATNTPTPTSASVPTATNTPRGRGHTPVTICHWVPAHGGSYILITVDDDGAFEGHAGHPNDIIPAPPGGCPTPTDTPTRTATPTRTSVPGATNTPTPTGTGVATATSTSIPTSTGTSVPTATNTAVPTATATPMPTHSPTPIATATSTPTTASATATSVVRRRTATRETRTPTRTAEAVTATATRVNIVLGSTPAASRTVVSTTRLPGTGSGDGDANAIFTGLLGALLLAAGLGLAVVGLRRGAS